VLLPPPPPPPPPPLLLSLSPPLSSPKPPTPRSLARPELRALSHRSAVVMQPPTAVSPAVMAPFLVQQDQPPPLPLALPQSSMSPRRAVRVSFEEDAVASRSSCASTRDRQGAAAAAATAALDDSPRSRPNDPLSRAARCAHVVNGPRPAARSPFDRAPRTPRSADYRSRRSEYYRSEQELADKESPRESPSCVVTTTQEGWHFEHAPGEMWPDEVVTTTQDGWHYEHAPGETWSNAGTPRGDYVGAARLPSGVGSKTPATPQGRDPATMRYCY
jgi:hypothetical protein